MSVRRATVISACVLGACTSMAQPDVPALIVDPNAESHGDLVSVVSAALNVADLTLADDALTHESMLVIERRPARDSTGQRVNGRDFGRPEQFQLVRTLTGCVLIHQSTGLRHALTKVKCKTA